MVIDNYINVSDDRLTSGLIPVITIMDQIEGSGDASVVLDLSKAEFISPVFALSLIVYLSKCGRQVSFCNVRAYPKAIGLGTGGLCPDRMRRSEFVATMERYAKKTYVPNPTADTFSLRHIHRKGISTFVLLTGVLLYWEVTADFLITR